MIDLERFQALLDPGAKPRATGVAHKSTLGIEAEAALGRDYDLIAVLGELIAQRAGEHPLRRAEAVGLRGVEEVDSPRASEPDRVDRLAFVEGAPIASQLPGPERDWGHLATSATTSTPAKPSRLTCALTYCVATPSPTIGTDSPRYAARKKVVRPSARFSGGVKSNTASMPPLMSRPAGARQQTAGQERRQVGQPGRDGHQR